MNRDNTRESLNRTIDERRAALATATHDATAAKEQWANEPTPTRWRAVEGAEQAAERARILLTKSEGDLAKQEAQWRAEDERRHREQCDAQHEYADPERWASRIVALADRQRKIEAMQAELDRDINAICGRQSQAVDALQKLDPESVKASIIGSLGPIKLMRDGVMTVYPGGFTSARRTPAEARIILGVLSGAMSAAEQGGIALPNAVHAALAKR